MKSGFLTYFFGDNFRSLCTYSQGHYPPQQSKIPKGTDDIRS